MGVRVKWILYAVVFLEDEMVQGVLHEIPRTAYTCTSPQGSVHKLLDPSISIHLLLRQPVHGRWFSTDIGRIGKGARSKGCTWHFLLLLLEEEKESVLWNGNVEYSAKLVAIKWLIYRITTFEESRNRIRPLRLKKGTYRALHSFIIGSVSLGRGWFCRFLLGALPVYTLIRHCAVTSCHFCRFHSPEFLLLQLQLHHLFRCHFPVDGFIVDRFDVRILL